MYLPTLSASVLVTARTRLWTEKPEWRQLRIFFTISYAGKPFEPVEEGMVSTLEPRLKVPERGIITVEEMVVVRKDGAEFLSQPQKELILI